MPKSNYRIPTLQERKLFAQVRDLEARLEALSLDPSAQREITHLKTLLDEKDSQINTLKDTLFDLDSKNKALREQAKEAYSKRNAANNAQKEAEHALKNEKKKTHILNLRISDLLSARKELLRQNRELKTKIDELETTLAKNLALIEHLNARLNRDCENSSVPPSSEHHKKRIPNSRIKTNKKPGGQLGHKGHPRPKQTPDRYIFLEPESDACPHCGCEMYATGKTRTHTVSDIEVRTITTGYVSSERMCPHCRTYQYDTFPSNAKNEANYGPNLKAAIAYLVGACNVSGANARDFLYEISSGKIAISCGSVINFMKQFSRLSKDERQLVFDRVATSSVIGTDATFTRAEGKTSYVYVFHTDDAAVFSANKTKGHAAILA